MQDVRQAALVTALTVVLVVSATPLVSANVAPRWFTGELADFAGVILAGRVERVTADRDPAVNSIYTVTPQLFERALEGYVMNNDGLSGALLQQTPPSSAPTGLNVTVNGTTSITVRFNAVDVLVAATAYRLDFRQSVNGPIIASLDTPTTSTEIPLPPGITGTFNVTVTAINSAGAGPSSAPVSFTLGGGFGGGGGCTSAPASPVVSGSLVSGTATVSWNSMPGATFYILSAGSSQGGSNLSATANIGPTTSVSATGLPPGFTAWVRVIAGNPCGQSAPTDFFLSGSGGPGPPGPPAPTTASILFGTAPDACGCWAASISVRIDSTPVGSMSCSGTAGPFSVPPGVHTLEACDPEGCDTGIFNLSTGETLTFPVGCT